MHSKLRIMLSVTMISGLVISPVSQAEDNNDTFSLEPLIVNASKRPETTDEYTGFISIADQQDLSSLNIQSVDELDKAFAGLLFSQRGNKVYNNITLRGQSSFDFYNPKVQVYIDGLPQEQGSLSQLLPANIDHVEVLYGPQGTLYGRGAVGGVINVITLKPGNEPLFTGTLGYGNLRRQVAANISSALIEDTLYFDLSAAYQKEEGEYEGLVSGADLGDTKNRDFRARLRYAPTSSPLDIMFMASHKKVDSTEEQYVPENRVRDRKALPVENHYEMDLDNYGLTIAYDFGSSVLTSISAYQDRDLERTVFSAYSPEQQSVFTQELRLASNRLADSTLSYVVGAYYEDIDFRYERPARGVVSLQESKAYALFGEATWYVNDKLDLTAGIRSDWHDVDATGIAGGFNVGGHDRSSAISPKLAAAYHLSDTTKIHAIYSTGFQAGGFPRVVTPAIAAFSYDPEKVKNYEIGITSLFNDRISFSAAAYITRTDDYQFVVGTIPNLHLQNVGDAESKGLDVQINAQLSDQLSANLSASWNESEFTAYSNPITPGVDLTGNTVPYAPEFSANLNIAYWFNLANDLGRITPSFNVQHVGGVYFDEANNTEQQSYTLYGLNLNWEVSDQFNVEIYGNNLSNKTYAVYGFDAGPPPFGFGKLYQLGRGAEGGLRINFQY